MQIVLNLKNLDAGEIARELRTYAKSLTDHAAEFPDPSPTPAELEAGAKQIDDAIVEVTRLDRETQAAVVARNGQAEAGKALLRSLVNWGEENIDDPAQAQLVFKMKKAARPTTDLARVLGLAATFGDKPGELDLIWQPVPKARLYEVQVRPLGAPEEAWVTAKCPSASSLTLKGQPSAQTVQVRVRALGPNELEGPWSDAAEHLVP